MTEIDPYGLTPVYVQVCDDLAARIERGDWKPNRPLPAETRLAEEYGVTRETIRRAVRELRERGLVATVHGRGTFVTPTREDPQP